MTDPTALSLADRLERWKQTDPALLDPRPLMRDAAAELRSLQAENEDWRRRFQWTADTADALRERLAATEDFTDIVVDALEAADKELTMLRDRGHDQVRSDVIDKVRQVLDRLNEPSDG